MQYSLCVTLFALPLVFCFSPAASAQDSFDGLARSLDSKPAGTYRTLSSGETLGFDGNDVVRFAADGTTLSTIALTAPDPSVGAFLFPSFVCVSPDETMALVGRTGCDSAFVNCSFGDLWFVDLLTDTATLHGPLSSNFDGVLFDHQTAYVNAKPCGFGCSTNEIHKIVAGAQGSSVVVQLTSEAGPVEVDAAGNLFVGTVDANFPPQPNGSDLYRFEAADVASGVILNEADGILLASGLQGAVDLALDETSGDVFLAANFFQTIMQVDATVNLVYLITPEGGTFVLYDGELGQTISNLEVGESSGSARLFGYQPETGGSFHFRTSEFVMFTSIDRTYVPARPQLTASASGSIATLAVTDGGANGVALFLYSPASLALTNEIPVTLPGLSHAPYFVGLNLGAATIDLNAIMLDSNGMGSQSYNVPLNLPPASYASQAIMLDLNTGLAYATTTVAIL